MMDPLKGTGVIWRCTHCKRVQEDIFTNGCNRCTACPLAPELDGKILSYEEWAEMEHQADQLRAAASPLSDDNKPQPEQRKPVNLSTLYWQVVALLLLLMISFPIGASFFNARNDLLLVVFFMWPFAVVWLIGNRAAKIFKELNS